MNYDDLLVIKHTLEDAIESKGVLARINDYNGGFHREPTVDMQRVLELIEQKLADIDANESGMLEIEAGDEVES